MGSGSRRFEHNECVPKVALRELLRYAYNIYTTFKIVEICIHDIHVVTARTFSKPKNLFSFMHVHVAHSHTHVRLIK
jgi:hypothetical protein